MRRKRLAHPAEGIQALLTCSGDPGCLLRGDEKHRLPRGRESHSIPRTGDRRRHHRAGKGFPLPDDHKYESLPLQDGCHLHSVSPAPLPPLENKGDGLLLKIHGRKGGLGHYGTIRLPPGPFPPFRGRDERKAPFHDSGIASPCDPAKGKCIFVFSGAGRTARGMGRSSCPSREKRQKHEEQSCNQTSRGLLHGNCLLLGKRLF